MKKKLVNTIAAIILTALVCIQAKDVIFASSSAVKGQIIVPKGCIMRLAESNVSRTLDYSYVYVKIDAVYPTGTYTEDTYKKCRVKLHNSNNLSQRISDVYTLIEGTGYHKVYINQGYLSITSFNMYFSGNNENYTAVVDYHYIAN